MKKLALSIIIPVIIIMTFVTIPSISWAEATTSFSLTQGTNSKTIGGTFEVTLDGNNLKDLYAYEASMSFDPKVVEINGATSKIEGFSVPPKVENNKILIAFTKIGKTAGENGSRPLLTVAFKIKSSGDPNLKLESVKALDSKLVPVIYQYSGNAFSDLTGFEWAQKQIESLAAQGIIKGLTTTTYGPGKNITRADFVSLLVRALKLTATNNDNFSDVKPTDHFYTAVGTAKKLGIVNGSGKNQFRPRESITRQEMMAMVVRAMKLINAATVSSKTDLSMFTDSAEIAPYAVDAASLLVKEGIIKGSNGKIRPKGILTRAETAVIIYSLINK